MALKRTGNKIIGLSSDVKPIPATTGVKVRTGTEFIETDTQKVAIFITDHWYYVDDQSLASS
jgi:hypothetical protein